MNIRTLAGVVVAAFVGTATAADDPAKDPLVGEWEGSWNYTTGMEEHIGTFRRTFARRASGMHGMFSPLEFRDIRMEPKSDAPNGFVKISEVEKAPSSGTRIQKLVRTSTTPTAYRWEADGYCWNVVIEGDRMSGVRNGGPCSSIGVGSAARLIEVVATRKNARPKGASTAAK